jgi:hypothetical protein
VQALPITITALKFMATNESEPEMNQEKTAQKQTRDGQLMWQTEVLMNGDGRKSEIIIIKTVGEKPKVTEGQKLNVADFAIAPWEMNGNKGHKFTASSITPAVATGKAA